MPTGDRARRWDNLVANGLLSGIAGCRWTQFRSFKGNTLGRIGDRRQLQ